MAHDPNAPTLHEALAEQGVPMHHHQKAIRAFAHWLHTWRGLEMSAELLHDRAESEIRH